MLLNTEQTIAHLEDELSAYAARIGVGVMHYNLAKREGRELRAANIGGSLYHFQRVVNIAAEKVNQRRPVKSARVSPQTQALALQWGHELELDDGDRRFLFLSERRTLLEDNITLDGAVGIVEELVNASTQKELNRLSNDVGKAAIAAVDEWATSNMHAGCAISVEWFPTKKIIKAVEPIQWRNLHTLIHANEVQSDRPSKRKGMLVGVVLEKRRFWFQPDDDDDVITGEFVDGVFSIESKAELPARYECELTCKTKFNEASDKTTREWKLHEGKRI